MRKSLCAAALVLALCGPAFAGDIPNPLGTQPPPPSVTNEVQAPDDEMQDDAADSLTTTVLGIIERILSLL